MTRDRLQTAALTGFLIVAAFACSPTSGSHAQNGSVPSRPKDQTIPAVVAAVRPSVVTIMARGVPANPLHVFSPHGSGLIIDGKGYILTTNHLVEGVKSLVVGLPTGRLTPGRVVARDFLLDLALVKIEAKDLVAATLGRSSSLQIGETVVVIGNPLKGGSTVSVGVVSALEQSILPPSGETLYDLIQTDAATNPGNSGGPLVDLSGRVVGLHTAVAPSAQAISYAISIDTAAPYIQAMLERGTVLRPDVGFVPVTVTPSVVASFNLEIDRGVLAAQLDPAKLVGKLGMQSGDVITAVDNVEIYNMGDFWHAYLNQGDKASAKLTVFGKKGSFSVTLPRPSTPSVNR